MLEGLKDIVDGFLSFFGYIIDGAAKLFGWVPGVGGMLKAAAVGVQQLQVRRERLVQLDDRQAQAWRSSLDKNQSESDKTIAGHRDGLQQPGEGGR